MTKMNKAGVEMLQVLSFEIVSNIILEDNEIRNIFRRR